VFIIPRKSNLVSDVPNVQIKFGKNDCDRLVWADFIDERLVGTYGKFMNMGIYRSGRKPGIERRRVDRASKREIEAVAPRISFKQMATSNQDRQLCVSPGTDQE
jgi:hypothetical protein